MLREIIISQRTFDELPEVVRDRIITTVQRGEAVAFVLNSNRLELVGTQDEAETRELCARAVAEGVPPAATSKQRKETMQTFQALETMHRLKVESRAYLAEQAAPEHQALMLTCDGIKEVHVALMQGLVKAPGTYRENDAYPEGFSFYYMAPDGIENAMFGWTDAINGILWRMERVEIEDAFKLAALALFHFVDVHPFSDGNGRMCRIIANSMLVQHHFFPVYIQPVTAAGPQDPLEWRNIYIDAIEACRNHPTKTPADLAALLIESSWTSWQRVNSLVAEYLIDGRISIGKIVVSSTVAASLTTVNAHVRDRYRTLLHSRRPSQPDAATAEEECATIIKHVKAVRQGETAHVLLSDGCVVVIHT
jgi:fido (protein-threonine AMPylation protein)